MPNPTMERRLAEYLIHPSPTKEASEEMCQMICQSADPEQYTCYTLPGCRRNPMNEYDY